MTIRKEKIGMNTLVTAKGARSCHGSKGEAESYDVLRSIYGLRLPPIFLLGPRVAFKQSEAKQGVFSGGGEP